MSAVSDRKSEVRWAVLRMVLGFLQLTGAMTTLLILLQLRDHQLTYAVGAVTLAITAVSMFVFRKKG